MHRLFRFIGVLIFAIATPAIAADGSKVWTVAQKSVDVRVFHPGMQPASVQIHASLTAGDVIATGPAGRAMLTRGDDYVVVAPDSRLFLPKEEQQSGFTRLVQQLGTMLYKVHHTDVPHFAVQTPMLAAVVKGTSFTVIVEQDRAAVQVTDGIVEVTSAVGQARRLVERGMTVYVGRERPDSIIEMRPGAVTTPGSGGGHTVKVASSGDVPLSTITSLTGGLVREAPTAPPVIAATVQNVGDVPSPTLTGVSEPKAVAAPVEQPTGNSGTPVTVTVSGNGAPVVTQPVAGVTQTTVPVVVEPVSATLGTVSTVTQPVGTTATPVVGIVQTAVPVVTGPAANIVQSTVPAVTQPVVGIVQTTVPAVTQPVVSLVQTTVPAVTQPVVNVVQAIVPAVTQPVVNLVPAVTQPVVNVVQTIVPPVTQPVVNVVPAVTQPVVNVVQTIVPAVTQPVGTVLTGLNVLLGSH